MRQNVIFCPSLAEAFAHVAMPYPEQKDMPPGKWSRFSTNGTLNNTDGWCNPYPDGAGARFGCKRKGVSFIWQRRESNAPSLTSQQYHDAREKAKVTREQADAKLAAQYAAAAITAATVLGKTVLVDTANGYVVRKGITPYLARQNAAGAIVLPVHGPEGDLQTLQFIYPEVGRKKKFMYQGKAEGGRLFIGKPSNGLPLVLVEGWAKGCSVHEATGDTVVIAFSAHNMATVAADLRRQFSASALCIAGDLDAHGTGRVFANAAAGAGAPANVLLPIFADGRDKGDWDDLQRAEGLEAVRQQLHSKPDVSPHELIPFAAPTLPKCDARDGTSDTRALSELGNAQRMLDAHGHCLQYVPDKKLWIVWKAGAWQWDSGAGVRVLVAGLPTAIYAEGVKHINDAEHFAKWARKSQEQRSIAATVSILSDFPSIRLPLAHIDSDHFTVGFDQARQVVNLCNGATRAATASDYITKSLSPAAVGNASKAVRWVQFLEQVFNGDGQLIEWLQRFTGYLLTGSTQEQIFLFCFGHGANGKSVFIEVLKHIMGDYGRAIASETLSEAKRQAGGATPDLAALIGARLVLCSETEDNTAFAESLVKNLVSGDSMAVRELYSAPVQFKPNFKLVMAGNHKPVVRGNDNGIWRRVRLVPFNRTFSDDDRDPHLLSVLKDEAPHILAWMIAGCINWHCRGLADTPATIRLATEAYKVDQDLTGRWLEECTVASAHDKVTSSDLYANYQTWSVANGLKPASSTALGRRLDERGYGGGKSAGVRVRFGLCLTDFSHTNGGIYSRVKGG
nr:phage/plasmid primase, P4 family [uncultured Noviherbaspirillum sp.]